MSTLFVRGALASRAGEWARRAVAAHAAEETRCNAITLQLRSGGKRRLRNATGISGAKQTGATYISNKAEHPRGFVIVFARRASYLRNGVGCWGARIFGCHCWSVAFIGLFRECPILGRARALLSATCEEDSIRRAALAQAEHSSAGQKLQPPLLSLCFAACIAVFDVCFARGWLFSLNPRAVVAFRHHKLLCTLCRDSFTE
jgi:hypothetical protein